MTDLFSLVDIWMYFDVTDLKNRTGLGNPEVGVREKIKPAKFNLRHIGVTTFSVKLL